jgi:hypothetical protein
VLIFLSPQYLLTIHWTQFSGQLKQVSQLSALPFPQELGQFDISLSQFKQVSPGSAMSFPHTDIQIPTSSGQLIQFSQTLIFLSPQELGQLPKS